MLKSERETGADNIVRLAGLSAGQYLSNRVREPRVRTQKLYNFTHFITFQLYKLFTIFAA